MVYYGPTYFPKNVATPNMPPLKPIVVPLGFWGTTPLFFTKPTKSHVSSKFGKLTSAMWVQHPTGESNIQLVGPIFNQATLEIKTNLEGFAFSKPRNRSLEKRCDGMSRPNFFPEKKKNSAAFFGFKKKWGHLKGKLLHQKPLFWLCFLNNCHNWGNVASRPSTKNNTATSRARMFPTNPGLDSHQSQICFPEVGFFCLHEEYLGVYLPNNPGCWLVTTQDFSMKHL